jgi:hypothetical protein
MRTSLISRVVVVGAALLCLASSCSVRKVSPNPNVDRRDGGGDGPGGGKGGYVRPNVGACASQPPDKKANGEACGCHDECGSGKCVDGVCCNNACLGTCQACNVPGLMGTCSPVPDGLAPVLPGQCQSQPAATCGPDGLCDGKGGCRNHPDGTVCATGRCQADGAAVADAKVCSGGSCTAAANIPCAPFACDDTTDRCHSRCTTDDQCAGVPCTNGQCGRKPLGAACDDANECLSGHCVDDVCCNLACAGGCVSCKEVGKVGQCSPVAAGNPDPHDKCLEQEPATCGQTGVCNGTGGCATYPAGTVCRPASCSGASLTPASVCNAQGTCLPGTNLSCAPYVCEGNACRGSCLDDGQCLAPASCQGGSCGPKGLGQPCAAGSACASSFCVDGVCCESACEGKCSFCALPNAPGRCQNAPLGALDPRAAAGVTDPTRICADEGVASCGQNGRCDGEGGCQRYPDGSMCTPESCDPATHRYSVGLCQAGSCTAGGRDCTPYGCNGNACALRCASNADCASPNVCQANSCGKIPDGGPCSANSPSDCASGICAQGVCCKTACGGTCQSCALTATKGTCTLVPNGGVDPAGTCVDQKPVACSTDGKCDGKGACRKYAPGSQCAPPSCASGQARKASFCTADGTCPAPEVETCTPIIVCNAGGTACERTCTRNDQCAAGLKCLSGRCGLQEIGQACTDRTDCRSGFCVDGVCCNEACGGTNTNDCQACSRGAGAAQDGTCAARNGLACNDGNRCTRTDVCMGTTCSGTNPVTCPTPNQCQTAGTCNPTTGTCTNPSKDNGTPCEDGNMCTVADTCQSGTCRAGAAKTCPTPNSCQNTCDPMTGMCNPPKPTGTNCNDGRVCTPGQDKCVGGVCTGTPKVCTSTNTCQVSPGTCNEANGACVFANKDNGAPCNADNNMCTMGDNCQNGTCQAGTAVVCGPTTCRQCNPTTGRCDGVAKPNRPPCEDGNACTQGDRCSTSGTCVAGPPRTCAVCNACDPMDGACKPAPGSCSDGMACTTDTCSGGQCVGTPRVCDDMNECTRDACNAANGQCVFEPLPMCPADAGIAVPF